MACSPAPLLPPCVASHQCVRRVLTCVVPHVCATFTACIPSLVGQPTTTTTALQTVYGSSLLVEARAGDGTDTEDLPPQARGGRQSPIYYSTRKKPGGLETTNAFHPRLSFLLSCLVLSANVEQNFAFQMLLSAAWGYYVEPLFM